jgi:bifunctional DNase/RNase
MVKIVEIRNNTFIGRLILQQGNKVVSLDSRPSDGIAIAVRTGSPVYIKESLMKEQGKYIC